MRRGGGGKVVRVVLSLIGLLVVLLALAQLLLPRIAASRISSRIGRYGHVTSVNVSAWPAVKLLWKDADNVTVRASDISVDPSQTDRLLAEARGTAKLDLRAERAREGPLAVTDVYVEKRGRELRASAFASAADVRAALPPGFDVQLLSSEGGKVEVRASGGLFGIGASVDAVAEAREGKLVVHPRGALIEALRLTLFDEPDVELQSIAAHAATGADGEAGYELEASATLR
ncbi:MAG TPA: hypothetical protein VK707_03200 [Solirubrobacteraceae bacterium]|jgi:hypothetical protein|nr:hypothetical protein [Solirubrobacteraceae bacterium]